MKDKKLIHIISIIISISIIILAILQLTNIWNKAIYVFEPLAGVICLIQAIENWSKNKMAAIINLIATIFIFSFTIYIIFLS